MDDLKPLLWARKPQYPLKRDFIHDPAMFELPERWNKNKLAGTAAGLALSLLLAGCAVKTPAKSSDTPEQTPSPSVETSKPLSIAFFEHGDGRGSFGCESVVPAVYFTEADAFEVINEAAKQYGVEFTNREKAVETIIPVTNTQGEMGEKSKLHETDRGCLTLDGYNDKLKIGFEFVSVDDIREWEQIGSAKSTVEEFKSKETARELNGYFNEENIPAAVFYEPFAGVRDRLSNHTYKDFAALEAQLREKSLEALKQQAVDFMEWLKSQGII